MSDTLPDLLQEGLEVVFVGINPSLYSAERGHYFARPSNRFWPCFSHSRLSERARRGLGVALLGPQHDTQLLAHGFGFTDLVKKATTLASHLTQQELAGGVADLKGKLARYRPRIACFHGVTGYRHVQRELAPARDHLALGLQPETIGTTRVFLVPNPSGANAHYTRADQTLWYDRLADELTRE